MNMHSFCKNLSRNILAVVAVSGFAIGIAAAGPNDNPQEAWTPTHSHTISGAISALSDTAITARVKNKLKGEASLKKSNINVSISDGVVTLYGSVKDAQAKSLAESVTKSVEGVKNIHNGLEISAAAEDATRPTGPKGPQEPADNRARNKD